MLGTAVEVGVYRGEFSASNLREWRGERYVMIDAWGVRTNDTKRAGERSDNNEPSQLVHDARYEAAELATRPWASRRTMIRAFSVPAAARFPDGSLDWYASSGFQPASCRRASTLPIVKAYRESHVRISC